MVGHNPGTNRLDFEWHQGQFTRSEKVKIVFFFANDSDQFFGEWLIRIVVESRDKN